MYSTRSGLILGFHGCDKSLVEDILLGKINLKDSKNKTVGNSIDLLYRELDCAVIETIHKVNSLNNDKSTFDSVKGVFWEGEELYPSAGFREKNHIQICVRNPNCIKGYFLPRELNDKFKNI